MKMTIAKRVGLTMGLVSGIIVLGAIFSILNMRRISRLGENMVSKVVRLDSATKSMNTFKTAARVELKTYLTEQDPRKLSGIERKYRQFILKHDQFEEEIGKGIDDMYSGKDKMKMIWEEGMNTIMPEFDLEVELAMKSYKQRLDIHTQRMLKIEEIEKQKKILETLLDDMKEANSGRRTITDPINNMKIKFLNARHYIFEYIFFFEKNAEESKRLYEKFKDSIFEFQRWKNKLQTAVANPGNNTRFKEISALHDSFVFLVTGKDQLYDLLEKEQLALLKSRDHSMKIDKLGELDWEMAGKITRMTENNIRDSAVMMKRSHYTAQLGIVLVSLIVIMISIYTVVLTYRRIIVPLKELTATTEIIGEGDLTKSIAVESSDEIGILAKSFDKMVEKLNGILCTQKDTVVQIGSAGNKILAAARQQATGAREQSAAINETTSAAIELSKNAAQIGENIKRVTQVANYSLVGMAKIKGSIGKTANIVSSLNEKSKKIGQITDLIDDVADQTNLLAVNAAIEAARAGEQGRGFAVVADQIQKLADSTAKSTKDITALIEIIQHEMSNVVLSMEQSSLNVEEEVKFAQETADKSKEIAMSTTQQVAGSRQIAEAMEDINDVMKQISQGAQNSEDAVKQLTHLADDIGKITKKFKTSG